MPARFIPNRVPLYGESRYSKVRELFDGISIGGGLKLRPAPYLPVLYEIPELYSGVVIEKGTFVTLDKDGYVVPAFVGKKNLTYTAIDVQLGVIDIDTGEPVTQPKTSAKTIGTDADADIKIGKPLGMLRHDAFVYYPDNALYQPQYELTILCDRTILLAVDEAHNNVNYEPGDLLVLDASGYPVPFDGTADKLKYLVGRLIKVIDVDKDKDWTSGLENVEYWPADFVKEGFPGKPSAGITDGVDLKTKKGLVIQLMF